MSTHLLERSQVVPGTLTEVFGFFKEPTNLEAITPPWLRFRVRSSTTEVVCRGSEIVYDLRWQIFPMRWHSRISEFEEDVMFADEMLSGPYSSWYHRHYFSAVACGVEVVDLVEYRLPFGPLGAIAHKAVVRRQLEAIFDHRHEMIDRIFPSPAVVDAP